MSAAVPRALLTGRQNEQKYESSYETIAKAIGIFASVTHRSRSLTCFFESLVLSVAVRNGDAHLKNFRLLYTTPQEGNVRLSPLYDVVCTTVYLARDTMALKMDKSKACPTRRQLIDFGRAHCQLDHPADIIDRICEVVTAYRPDVEPGAVWRNMQPDIAQGCHSIS